MHMESMIIKKRKIENTILTVLIYVLKVFCFKMFVNCCKNGFIVDLLIFK